MLEAFDGENTDGAVTLWIVCDTPPGTIMLPIEGITLTDEELRQIRLLDCDDQGCRIYRVEDFEDGMITFSSRWGRQPVCDGGCTFALIPMSAIVQGIVIPLLVILLVVGLVVWLIIVIFVKRGRDNEEEDKPDDELTTS